MKLYFKDQAFSFELLRAVSYAGYQGAELGECLAVAANIEEGNFDSWYTQWCKVAMRVEKIGRSCLEKGHLVSAREALLRANNYYRTAEFFLDGNDPRRNDNFDKSVECFELAMSLLETSFEIVEIPYENGFLKGYLYKPACYDPKKQSPLLLGIGGYDSTLQELYFCFAAPAIKRKYACLIFECPGQGEALRKQNLYMRTDAEIPVGAAIDYVSTRNDVNIAQIALAGMSLGGYFAPRAAAFDKRIKACIAFNVFYDAYQSTVNQNPALRKILALPEAEQEKVLIEIEKNNSNLRWLLNNGRWVFGCSKRHEVFHMMKKASLKDVAKNIACPILLTMGANDHFVSDDQLDALKKQIQAPLTIRIFTAEEGAEEHCQEGNHALFHQEMFDWLDDVF